MEKYNFKGKTHNGYIFAWVTKGIYEISQAGWIAHYALVKHLKPYVYRPSRKTLGIRTHDSHPINFTLVVDDFGVKYCGKQQALHLKAALKEEYKVTIYCEVKLYIGIALTWYCEKSRSNYPYQDMYVQHYIHSNTRNQKYHMISYIPGHILSMERTTRRYQRKTRWRIGWKEPKMTPENRWKIPVLC